jgi:hypothetical protein
MDVSVMAARVCRKRIRWEVMSVVLCLVIGLLIQRAMVVVMTRSQCTFSPKEQKNSHQYDQATQRKNPQLKAPHQANTEA